MINPSGLFFYKTFNFPLLISWWTYYFADIPLHATATTALRFTVGLVTLQNGLRQHHLRRFLAEKISQAQLFK